MSRVLLNRFFGRHLKTIIPSKMLVNAPALGRDDKPLSGVLQPDEEALKLKQAVAQTKLKLDTVMSLIEFEQDLIKDFLEETTHALKDILNIMGSPATTNKDLKQRVENIFCIVHQVKGDSAILNLTGIASHAHNLENGLYRLSIAQKLSPKDLNQLVPPFKAMISGVREVKSIFDMLISGGWNHKAAITEDSMGLKLEYLMRKLSKDCSKKVIIVNDGYTDSVMPANLRPIISSLVTQLARNSVVHGIEPEETRKKLRKTPYGCFHISARRQEGYVEIIARDDGSGIDSEKIRETVIKTKRYTRQQLAKCTEANLLQAIFIPGFTTIKKVTEHAGMGVGLDLIKKTVKKYKGTIEVQSTPGQFTEFTMRFPTTNAIKSS